MLSTSGPQHRAVVLTAVERGVPMDLIAHLHGHDYLGRDCGFLISGLHQAIRSIIYFLDDGGRPEQVRRFITQARESGAHVHYETGVFARQGSLALARTGVWADSRDWPEEAVTAAEAGRSCDVARLLPADMIEQYAPRMDEWDAIVHVAATDNIAVPDLAQHLPVMPEPETDPRHWHDLVPSWRKVARWQQQFGAHRTGLLVAADLSEEDAAVHDLDDDSLLLLAARRDGGSA